MGSSLCVGFSELIRSIHSTSKTSWTAQGIPCRAPEPPWHSGAGRRNPRPREAKMPAEPGNLEQCGRTTELPKSTQILRGVPPQRIFLNIWIPIRQPKAFDTNLGLQWQIETCSLQAWSGIHKPSRKRQQPIASASRCSTTRCRR